MAIATAPPRINSNTGVPSQPRAGAREQRHCGKQASPERQIDEVFHVRLRC